MYRHSLVFLLYFVDVEDNLSLSLNPCSLLLPSATFLVFSLILVLLWYAELGHTFSYYYIYSVEGISPSLANSSRTRNIHREDMSSIWNTFSAFPFHRHRNHCSSYFFQDSFLLITKIFDLSRTSNTCRFLTFMLDVLCISLYSPYLLPMFIIYILAVLPLVYRAFDWSLLPH
ncbi:hypothetical protein F5890DRAFT_1198920 [Lentinula detonsa]|uniref:Uncharacterized protein n=1 Tax=Lentinula detonsa TaxID=2804962 RepID=A0AA38Q0C8_9AGAR|nr:hypothetical protein F5890DRAFT_1198920 [Lentinula detonsa]